MKAIVGVDICEADGISEVTAVEFISEVGTDMNKWKSDKHFAAWLNVAPNTKITGGKIISSKMQRKKNHAGQILRMSCCSMSLSNTPMGDYARKMKSRLGKKGGVVATTHKQAKILYAMIKYKRTYERNKIGLQQKKWKQQRIKYLEKQLKQIKRAS